VSVGASFQTPLGKLTVLPKPLSGFKEATLRQEGNGREGRIRRRGERERERKWEWRGKGKLGRIAPWLLGDRHPC